MKFFIVLSCAIAGFVSLEDTTSAALFRDEMTNEAAWSPGAQTSAERATASSNSTTTTVSMEFPKLLIVKAAMLQLGASKWKRI